VACESAAFESTTFGYIHIDLKHLPRLDGQSCYVFVAIERSTRFVHVEVVDKRDAETVSGCLSRFLEAFPGTVHTILTDNGSEFSDRFAVDKKNKPADKPSGNHAFDRVCAAHGIQHKLTRPFRPQTNGMVERFNRRLAQAIGQQRRIGGNSGKNTFKTRQQRQEFIHHFVDTYNRTRLKCLNYVSPQHALHNHAELYTFAGAGSNPRKATPFRRFEGSAQISICSKYLFEWL
jgi:transposase InsO family protein